MTQLIFCVRQRKALETCWLCLLGQYVKILVFIVRKLLSVIYYRPTLHDTVDYNTLNYSTYHSSEQSSTLFSLVHHSSFN